MELSLVQGKEYSDSLCVLSMYNVMGKEEANLDGTGFV